MVKRLAEFGFDQLERIRTATEDITFALPSGLAPPRRAAAASFVPAVRFGARRRRARKRRGPPMALLNSIGGPAELRQLPAADLPPGRRDP